MSVTGLWKPEVLETLPRRVKINFSFLATAGFLIFSLFTCSKMPSYPSPQRVGADIVIETSSLELEVPKFYTYHFQGKDINFFVIKMPDTILSFLDACRSCYPHKQGYRCNDKDVVCRYCNTRYPISKLEKGLGNCYPIRIAGRMENAKYLIPAAMLEQSADKF